MLSGALGSLAWLGDLDALRAGLRAGVRGELDVYAAAALDDGPRLEALLAAEPGLATAFSPEGWTALHLACFFGAVRCADLLLESGAGVNTASRDARRTRPLHAATAGRQAEVVGLLLDWGAEPDATDGLGHTAIHAAAAHGDDRLVDMLLDAAADVAAAAHDGSIPADAAEAAGHAALAARLRRGG